MADDPNAIDEALLKVQAGIEALRALGPFKVEWLDTPGWADSPQGRLARDALAEVTRAQEAFLADPSEASEQALHLAENVMFRANRSAKRLVVSCKTDGSVPTDLARAERLIQFGLSFLSGRINPADPGRLRRADAAIDGSDTSRRVSTLDCIATARAGIECADGRRRSGHLTEPEYEVACQDILENLRAELSWFVDTLFEKVTAIEIARHLRDKRKGDAAVAAELSLSTGAFGDVAAPDESHEEAIHRISGRYSAAKSALLRS